MVYPKVIEALCRRVTSLLLIHILLTVTWTRGEAPLASESKSNEGPISSTGNNDKSSSSSLPMKHHQLPKRSVSIPEEVLNRWNLNPSPSSGFIGSSSSSSSPSDNSPSSSLAAVPSSYAPSSSLTDEYETDLDSSLPLSPQDSDFIKRDDSRYAFGLGKRGSSADTRYSFGIGKRLPEMSRYMTGSKRLPNRFQFGLGKKSRYSFGLGKRDLYEYIKRRYNFGIGKRAATQRYAFGLGK